MFIYGSAFGSSGTVRIRIFPCVSVSGRPLFKRIRIRKIDNECDRKLPLWAAGRGAEGGGAGPQRTQRVPGVLLQVGSSPH